MNLLADLKTLYHLTLAPIRGQTHAERLESFYRGQAGAYDEFRERLLHGRREMFAALAVPEGGVWVDMGGGTGSNVEHLADRLHLLRQLYIVDLAPSLLAVAQVRIADRGWSNVATVEADACTFRPVHGPVDVITFSYSLTMIPDWFAALDHAWELLRPGGLIGIVDFYVARKHPVPGHIRHSWLSRTFWPIWFGHDNVFLNPDHVPYLHRRFEAMQFSECAARVPCLPGNVPYYIFVGRKAK
jgi:S-adenosylmethionine-diacylgycerolhomoserine-N-methlytransferase